MNDTKQQEPKKLVREIVSLTCKHRVGPPNEADGQLETVTTKVADIDPAVHKLFGPGVWLRFHSAKGYVAFVPVGNIRRLNFTEREE